VLHRQVLTFKDGQLHVGEENSYNTKATWISQFMYKRTAEVLIRLFERRTAIKITVLRPTRWKAKTLSV